MPPGIDPLPFRNSRDESQRDSVSKPRVASRELPWVNIVRRPLPQRGCDHRASPEAATPLGLTANEPSSQGSLADSATLGWRIQSLWDCRAIGLSVVPYDTGLARNIRKAWAQILAALDLLVRPLAGSHTIADKNVRAPALVMLASRLIKTPASTSRAAFDGPASNGSILVPHDSVSP